jgi:hypothetical protein
LASDSGNLHGQDKCHKHTVAASPKPTGKELFDLRFAQGKTPKLRSTSCCLLVLGPWGQQLSAMERIEKGTVCCWPGKKSLEEWRMREIRNGGMQMQSNFVCQCHAMPAE